MIIEYNNNMHLVPITSHNIVNSYYENVQTLVLNVGITSTTQSTQPLLRVRTFQPQPQQFPTQFPRQNFKTNIILLLFIKSVGNVFVIAAIILERNLQNVANYLVASLAVADLLVACLVMPLGAVYEVRVQIINCMFVAWFSGRVEMTCFRGCAEPTKKNYNIIFISFNTI